MPMAIGEHSDGKGMRRAKKALAYAWFALFVALVALGGAVSFLNDPTDTETVARLELHPPAKAPQPQAAPASGLSEASPQGALPQIAEDGRKPMDVYAGAEPKKIGPRVAIVIGGLGISARMTSAALDALPPEVTLSFRPYAGDVAHWASEARKRGHEILIEVPMEPYDFPDSDPGQYTLRVGTDSSANIQRLNWALTRISGYAGATNLLGARFLGDREALDPVLKTLATRGVLFFDNGSVQNSVAREVAATDGTAFVAADETIDSIQSAMEIDQRLEQLVAAAKSKGTATGIGYVYYPVTVERVVLWSRTLPSKGVVLAPLTAVVSKSK